MSKDIYPIYLPSHVAEGLVTKHAVAEMREGIRYHSSSAEYDFSAKLLENGDVVLHVHYTFDDGFAMGAGPVLDKTIRPYTAEQLEAFRKQKMVKLATAAYEEQQETKRRTAILKLAEKMFGEKL